MWKRFKRLISNSIEILKRPDMQILPGQLAFFFILSLVPTITLLFYFASFLNISITDITSYLGVSLSGDILTLLTPAIEDTSLTFGLIILICVDIFIASNGTSSIIVTANSIYGIEPQNFIKRKIKAIIMIFVIILLFLFILLVPIFGNFLFSLLEQSTGSLGVKDFLSFLKIPFSWFTIFFFIKLLYTLAPDKDIPSSYVNIGALFTSIGWVIATEVYLYYVGHFAHYGLYYSGLSNIAILMIWMYILAFIFVIGMGINYKEEPYEIERTQKIEEIKAAKRNQNKINKDDTD